MTNKEFFEKIANGETITEEMVEKAKAQLAKIKEADEKRKEKNAERRREDQGTLNAIVEILDSAKEPMTAKEIGDSIGITFQKAGSLLSMLISDEIVAVGELRKRARTYFMAKKTDNENENEEE